MLVLIMSISGSVVFLTAFLCAVLGKKVLPPAWAYNMMKIALIFFCIPLPNTTVCTKMYCLTDWVFRN